jgi:polysaccharide export outer membrane protein
MKKFCAALVFTLFIVVSAQANELTYLIGPGDELEISVWKDESLSRTLIVPPDGIVSFPLIGGIEVSNLTVKELKEAVTKKLYEFIPDATVTVMLINAASLKAYVIGKVNNPGEFPINLETTVMQLLAMAEGLNPFADQKNILILRNKDGQTQKIPFDYRKVEKGDALEQNIRLKRGDIVIVP